MTTRRLVTKGLKATRTALAEPVTIRADTNRVLSVETIRRRIAGGTTPA